MGYGVQRFGACLNCGAELTLLDLYADPPPIPMRVKSAIVTDDGRTTSECPYCEEEVDVDALLGNPPVPPRPTRMREHADDCPARSGSVCRCAVGVQADIARELREIDARFNDPDPFVRHAAAREFKG